MQELVEINSETLKADRVEKARIALIWTDIGNYHAARSLAASRIAYFDVETIEILRQFRIQRISCG